LNSRPIGVYDSGVGGLTVVREISSKLPWERVVYFGDTARVPYGEKTAQELLGFSREIIEFLIDQGSKYIIAACNTTSSQVLEDVKKEFDVPVIGVLRPGAYAASVQTIHALAEALGVDPGFLLLSPGKSDSPISSLMALVAMATPEQVELITKIAETVVSSGYRVSEDRDDESQ
jgi:glutamate racemase